MLVYATSADFTAWAGVAAPANVNGLLRSASLAVREATEFCFYATDSTGMPTDTAYVQAFNDATACQANFLNTVAQDPNLGGVLEPGVEQQASLGSAHVTYADAQDAADARKAAVLSLCPDALRILRVAGLVPKPPWQVG